MHAHTGAHRRAPPGAHPRSPTPALHRRRWSRRRRAAAGGSTGEPRPLRPRSRPRPRDRQRKRGGARRGRARAAGSGDPRGSPSPKGRPFLPFLTTPLPRHHLPPATTRAGGRRCGGCWGAERRPPGVGSAAAGRPRRTSPTLRTSDGREAAGAQAARSAGLGPRKTPTNQPTDRPTDRPTNLKPKKEPNKSLIPRAVPK